MNERSLSFICDIKQYLNYIKFLYSSACCGFVYTQALIKTIDDYIVDWYSTQTDVKSAAVYSSYFVGRKNHEA
jgi:hypothetical protein